MKAPSLIVAIPHRGSSHAMMDHEESDDDEPADDGGDAEDIAHQLADLLDVPEDKRDDFAELLHAYVEACA